MNRRLSLLLTCLVLLPACSGWHPTPLHPDTAPVIDDREPVRVKPRTGIAVLVGISVGLVIAFVYGMAHAGPG